MATPDRPIAETFALILAGLRDVAAAYAGRHRNAAPIVLLLWPYLHRVAARFARLVARWKAGKLAPPKPRAHIAAVYRPRKPGLPRGFAWVLRLVPDAAPVRTQIEAWLAHPDMAALLAAAPQAGRILRPLCRMLGCSPADLPPELHKPPATRRKRPPDSPLGDRTSPGDASSPTLAEIPPDLFLAPA